MPRLLLLPIFLLLFPACSTPLKPTGDKLVSVSWVNPTPLPLREVETRLKGSGTPVKLDVLPAYSEIAVETNQPLYKNATVKTHLVAGSQTLNLESARLEAPRRKSPEREYNLRIQLRQNGLPSEVTLEPVHLTRARLGE